MSEALIQARRRVLKAGEKVFDEGDPGDEAYVIEYGRVVVFKTIQQKRVDLGEVVAGGIFGEMALIDGQPRMASAVATEDTACVVIGKERLAEQLERAPKGVRVIVGALLGNIRLMGAELTEARLVLAEDERR